MLPRRGARATHGTPTRGVRLSDPRRPGPSHRLAEGTDMTLPRWLAAALGALLCASVVVFPGPPAHAADPVPGPVDEIFDVPSRLTKSVPTFGPMGDKVIGMMLRGQRWTVGGGALVPATPSTALKPITPPANFTRGVGATAGSAIVGASYLAGVGIGTGGLYLYGAATGTDAYQGYCGFDDAGLGWVQDIHGALNFGIQPGCYSDVVTPNVDVTQVTQLSYGGLVVRYVGSAGSTASSVGCAFRSSGTVPAGHELVGGSSFSGGWTGVNLSGAGTTCNNAYGANANANWLKGTGSAIIRLRNASTGATVADSTTTSADPNRNVRCKVTWEDGTTTTGAGVTYKESTGFPMTAPGTGCKSAWDAKPGRGPNMLPRRVQIESENTEGGAITQIADQPVPEFGPDERKAFETGNGHGLVLEKVTGVTVSSCMTWAADCSGWWAATSSGTQPQVGSSTYRCTYGGSQVALNQCGPYRYTFDTKTQTPTITDPATGEEVQWSAQPNVGNSLSPGVGPGTGASPSEACFDTGWAEVANPVDWVLVPVKCALVWAFVPRQSVIDNAQGSLGDAVDESVVGSVGDSLAVLGQAFDVGVGCGGLPFHLEAFGHTLVDAMLLESCSEPAAGIAATVRTILSVAIIGGGILAFTRYLGALFGFESFGRNRSEAKSGGPSFD